MKKTLLIFWALVLATFVQAQIWPTNLLTGITNVSIGTPGAGLGDPAYVAFSKLNENDSIESNTIAQLFAYTSTLPAAARLPANTPPPVMLIQGDSFNSLSNMAPVMTWPDVTGNGNTAYALGTNSYYVFDSYPSVYCAGTANGNPPYGFVVTNFFQNYPSLNTNCTMVFVMKANPSVYSPGNTFGSYLCGAGLNSGSVDDGFRITGYGIANGEVGGGFDVNNYNSVTFAISDQSPKYHVYVIHFDGTYWSCYEDGLSVMQNNISWTYANSASYIGATNNLYIFNKASTGSYPFNGSLALMGVFTNTFTQGECISICASYALKYGLQNKLVLLDGDSEVQSVKSYYNFGANNGTTYTADMATLMPQWDFICNAQGGRDSLEVLSNQQNWLYSRRNSAGPNIVVSDVGAYNDIIYANAPNGISMNVSQAAAQLILTETNVIQYCNNCHSNNWKVYIATMISGFWETNGFKTNFNNWLNANYSGFADGIADWAASPPIGTNNAFVNSTMFYEAPVGLHLTTVGTWYQATNTFMAITALPLTSFPAVIPSITIASNINVLSNNTQVIMYYGARSIFTTSTNIGTGSGDCFFIGQGFTTNTQPPITGFDDIGIGFFSMEAGPLTGSHDIGIGCQSLLSVTSGSENIGIGYGADGYVTTSIGNVAVGHQALDVVAGDNNNTAIGYEALHGTVGPGNIALGANAGVNMTASTNDIYIGNNGPAGGVETGVIRIGTPGTHTNTIIAGNVEPSMDFESTNGVGITATIQIITNLTHGVYLDITNGLIVGQTSF